MQGGNFVDMEPHVDMEPQMVDASQTQQEIIGGNAVTRGMKQHQHHLKATKEAREWRTGLLCCCEGGAGSCLYGFCCPPCATASARSRLDNSDWWMNLFFLNSYTAYKLIADRYNIETDPCCDCCSCQCDICRGFWCMPCIVVQMLNEVKAINPHGPTEENSIYFGPAEATNHWSTGLCGCTQNMETCPFITIAGLIPFVDFFCLKAFNAQALTMQINHEQNGHGLNTMEHGYNCSDGCFSCGYDGWWFNWCCVSPVITRNYIRDQNKIGGCCKQSRCLNIIMNDVVPTWCCYWCTTCQNLNEVIFETANEGISDRQIQSMNQLSDTEYDDNHALVFW